MAREADELEDAGTQVVPKPPTVSPSEAAPVGFRIVVLAGPDRGLVADIGTATIHIGKAPGCELTLTDPGVSRKHLRLRAVDGGLEVQDLASTNGSYFEGARFDRLIVAGDGLLTIGETDLKVVRERRAQRRPITRIRIELTDDDLVDIVSHGLTVDDARHQLAFLSMPPPPVLLLRAASAGDGILRIPPERHAELLASWSAGAAAGRLAKFIPASGGATRMFEALIRLWTEGEQAPGALQARAAAGEQWAADALRFHDARRTFAFWPELEGALAARGQDGDATPFQIAAALLDRRGLDYARRPKGLVHFHAPPGGTPIEAHVLEALETVLDDQRRCRVHFTVPEEHRDAFRQVVNGAADRLKREAIELEADLSTQAQSTDAIAVTSDGRPFRTEEGALLFRPSGHGALLANLQASDLDLVHIKNVDNVMPPDAPSRRIELVTTRLLFGLALLLDAEIRRHTRAIEDAGDATTIAAAVEFLRRDLGSTASIDTLPLEEQRVWALDRLGRPLRVCGMVANQGEPGGGPFWTVNSAGEPSLQIVEAAQVARSPEQRALLATSLYFNPVDLVCVLRDAQDQPHHLERWLDPATSFVVEKSFGGRRLRSIERPGLWNGAMARWNTVFVEIPKECFAPVKTVLDLLRGEHATLTA